MSQNKPTTKEERAECVSELESSFEHSNKTVEAVIRMARELDQIELRNSIAPAQTTEVGHLYDSLKYLVQQLPKLVELDDEMVARLALVVGVLEADGESVVNLDRLGTDTSAAYLVGRQLGKRF